MGTGKTMGNLTIPETSFGMLVFNKLPHTVFSHCIQPGDAADVYHHKPWGCQEHTFFVFFTNGLLFFIF